MFVQPPRTPGKGYHNTTFHCGPKKKANLLTMFPELKNKQNTKNKSLLSESLENSIGYCLPYTAATVHSNLKFFIKFFKILKRTSMSNRR